MPAIKREFKTSLRVLSYKQNDRCIAHCLEFDLIGEGTELSKPVVSAARRRFNIKSEEFY